MPRRPQIPPPAAIPDAAPAHPAPPDRWWRTSLALVLAAYAVLQALYLTATPLQTITLPDNLPRTGPASLLVGIGPDEKEHFLYILSLAHRAELPAPSPSLRRSPEQYVSYQAQHPPLFYVLGALVYRATAPLGLPAAWYLLRGLCALCGGFVIVLAARAARATFPDRPLVWLAAAPFVAFLPMFGHLTANLSNEPLAMVFGAWAWLQMTRIARSATPLTVRTGALLGVTLGIAALTRLTALLWLPPALILLGLGARRERTAAPLAAALVCFAALLLPWLAHNQIAYGTPLLRTFDRPMLAYGSLDDFFGSGILPPNAPIVLTPLTTTLWYASTAWMPFWLVQFYLPGGLQVAPAWQAILLLISVSAPLALFLHASRSRRESSWSDLAGRALLWAAASAVTLCALAVLQQQLYSDWNVVNSAGRYLVAAVPAAALLFLFALSTLWTPQRQRGAALVTGILMLLFDLHIAVLVRQFYADHPTQPAVQRVEGAG